MINYLLKLPVASKLAFLAALVSIVTSSILIVTSYQGQRELIHRSADYFADSLIKQLSRDASAAIVQKDRLSLQSQLTELSRSDIVLHATVYDVENEPIAEAGEALPGRSYTASISFQDSLAGYVVLTLDSRPLSQLNTNLVMQLCGLAIVLAIACALLARRRSQGLSVLLIQLSAILRSPSPRRMALNSIGYRGEDEFKQLASDIVSPPKSAEPDMSTAAVLHIDFGFFCGTDTLQRCYRQLQTICRLYDGQASISRNDGISAFFYARVNESDPVFRAVCAGYLFTSLEREDNCPDFGAGVALSKSERGMSCELAQQIAINDAQQTARPGNKKLYCEARVSYLPTLEERIIIIDDDDGFLQITAFKSPYSELLTGQLSSLERQNNQAKTSI